MISYIVVFTLLSTTKLLITTAFQSQQQQQHHQLHQQYPHPHYSTTRSSSMALSSSTPTFQSGVTTETKKKESVCIIGGGNAAHALAALLPFQGYEKTTMYCPYKDEAKRINDGLAEQDGFMIADFASHNTPSGIIRGKPMLVSKDPQEVIPDADVLIMPLPSFVYPSTLQDIKPYLHDGQILCVRENMFEKSNRFISYCIN